MIFVLWQKILWCTDTLVYHCKPSYGSSLLQWNLPEWPPLLSHHLLTKTPIGSSLSQIAISETSHKWPPPISDHGRLWELGSTVLFSNSSLTSQKFCNSTVYVLFFLGTTKITVSQHPFDQPWAANHGHMLEPELIEIHVRKRSVLMTIFLSEVRIPRFMDGSIDMRANKIHQKCCKIKKGWDMYMIIYMLCR